jgi:hypothetical protein
LGNQESLPNLDGSDSSDEDMPVLEMELDPETDLQACRLRPVSLQRRVVSDFPSLSPAPGMKFPGANPER